MKKSDLKYFTVDVSLEDVSNWCGLAPSVVVAYAREFGVPIIYETDDNFNGDYDVTIYFEVYLDFVLQAGLPIDTALNPDAPRLLSYFGLSIDENFDCNEVV